MQMKGENVKLLCWSLALQEMDMEVVHKQGTMYKNVDALSRAFECYATRGEALV